MDFFKALIPAGALTFAVAGIMGKAHSKGAYLHIHRVSIDTFSFHWSWPLFLAGTVLAWALVSITPK